MKRRKDTAETWLYAIGIMVMLFLLCLTLTGCRQTREVVREVPVPVEVVKTETKSDTVEIHHYREVEKAGDTIRQHDSVFVREVKRVEVHDTTERPVYIKEPEPYPVEVEVEKPLTWWQQTKQKGFWVLLAVVGIYILLKVGIPKTR